MSRLIPLFPALALLGCAAPAVGYAPGTTAAQRDQLHRNTTPPEVAELTALTSTTVQAEFDLPIDELERWFLDKPLEDILRGHESIPAVRTTVPLSDAWGRPGDRRRVELADQSAALEQVLDNELPVRFRYVVWNYTSNVARYVDYGVGEFRFEPAGNRTRVTWTYAFKPKRSVYAGPLRRFVEGEYRDFMIVSVGHMQHSAASWSPGAASDDPQVSTR